MTIEYLDSKRIKGTAEDRTGSPAVSGGWVEIGRTTLGSAGDLIDVTSLPDKQYLMILENHISSGNINTFAQLNGDTGSNYAWRRSFNGGSDGGYGCRTEIETEHGSGNASNWFSVQYVANKSDKEKIGISQGNKQESTGSGNAPNRVEVAWKWANSSDPISRYEQRNNGGVGHDYDTGSEVVVLGYDPDDTHTTNFWEELASVELGSAGDVLSSGTITAKKYLWIQTSIIGSGDNNPYLEFNSDTASNYARRHSSNGATDATGTNTSLWFNNGTAHNISFANMFVINNSANEKLVISNSVGDNTAGAGTAPDRREFVGKWANTSSQITSVQIKNSGSGDFDTGSILKVWGHD